MTKLNILKELRALFSTEELHRIVVHEVSQIIAIREMVKKLEPRLMTLKELAMKVGLVPSLDVRIPRRSRRQLVKELSSAGWRQANCRCRTCLFFRLQRYFTGKNPVWCPPGWSERPNQEDRND